MCAHARDEVALHRCDEIFVDKKSRRKAPSRSCQIVELRHLDPEGLPEPSGSEAPMAPIGRHHEGWNFPAHQYGFMRFGKRVQLVPGLLRVELGKDLGVAPAIFVVADADEPRTWRQL
jgi:hypothetical protein